MALKDNFRRLVGGYIVGFHIASDMMAYAAKKGMKTLHSTACSITPIILTHTVINRFEKARDRAMLKIHEHAICTRCGGKGYLTVMSLGGEPVGTLPCPQCTRKGYLRMIGKRDDQTEATPLHSSSSKKELAIKVFDSIMNTARKEKTVGVIYCSTCKGQRFAHVRNKDGIYQGQKRCPACDGTGKDYKAMATEVMKQCLKCYLKMGYSKEKAWEFSLKTCFDTATIDEKHLKTVAESKIDIKNSIPGDESASRSSNQLNRSL